MVGISRRGAGCLAFLVALTAQVAAEPAERIHFDHLTNRDGLSQTSVFAILQDRQGFMWFGTADGLNRYDGAAFKIFKHRPGDPNSLLPGPIRALHEDSTGSLWIAAGLGLSQWDPLTGSFTHYRHDPSDPHSLNGHRIYALAAAPSGGLWIGSFGGGLSRFDPVAKRFIHYRHDPDDPTSLSNDRVSAINLDSSGRPWIGTHGGGLSRLDPAAESFTHYRHADGDPHSLSDDRVMSLEADSSGGLWVATDGGGLNRFVPATESFTHYRHDPDDPTSLSEDDVFLVFEDTAGGLWIGASGGLNRFDSAHQSFARHQHDPADPTSLSRGTVRSIFEDAAGSLWIGTSGGGLSRFDPARETLLHSYVPPIVVTSFKIFGQEVDRGRSSSYLEEIELGHQDNFFSFEFAALSFTNPDKNQYAHILENFDDSWIESGTRRYASYTNVPAGDYTLRIRGSSSDGGWHYEGTSIAIVVRPPPWRTGWAYTLYVMTLASVITGYIRSRKREIEYERATAERQRAISRRLREADALKSELIAGLEAKNVELANYNRIIAHDLQSSLATIGSFVDVLRHDMAAGNTERLESSYDRIHLATDRMRQLLEGLPEYSRAGDKVTSKQTVQLGELAHEAMRPLSNELTARGMEVYITPDLPAVIGDRARLLEVFRALFDNAVKFMGDQPRPRIEVGIRQSQEEVSFYMRDNGIGIDPRSSEKIFGLFERLNPAGDSTGMGLALAKRTVEAHGGRIWVESEGPGLGSLLCVTLPRAGPGASLV